MRAEGQSARARARAPEPEPKADVGVGSGASVDPAAAAALRRHVIGVLRRAGVVVVALARHEVDVAVAAEQRELVKEGQVEAWESRVARALRLLKLSLVVLEGPHHEREQGRDGAKLDGPPEGVVAGGGLAEKDRDPLCDPVQHAPIQADHDGLDVRPGAALAVAAVALLEIFAQQPHDHEGRGQQLAEAHDVHDALVDRENQALGHPQQPCHRAELHSDKGHVVVTLHTACACVVVDDVVTDGEAEAHRVVLFITIISMDVRVSAVPRPVVPQRPPAEHRLRPRIGHSVCSCIFARTEAVSLYCRAHPTPCQLSTIVFSYAAVGRAALHSIDPRSTHAAAMP
eukprot:COSAG05_NODE_4811_length_1363_cov_1.565665_1_plen_343_part_00